MGLFLNSPNLCPISFASLFEYFPILFEISTLSLLNHSGLVVCFIVCLFACGLINIFDLFVGLSASQSVFMLALYLSIIFIFRLSVSFVIIEVFLLRNSYLCSKDPWYRINYVLFSLLFFYLDIIAIISFCFINCVTLFLKSYFLYFFPCLLCESRASNFQPNIFMVLINGL